MKTVPIPGGEAIFRTEKSEYRTRDVELIEAASIAASTAISKLPPEVVSGEEDMDHAEVVQAFELTFSEAMSLLEARHAAVIAGLVGWTLREPDGRIRKLPTMETFGDLDRDLSSALLDAVGVTPDVSTDFSPSLDKESPTTASNGSNGPSEATVTSESTTTPSDAGESTGSEKSTPV